MSDLMHETRWLDMSAHGLTLAVCEVSGVRLLGMAGSPSDAGAESLSMLGFVKATDDLWVRDGDQVDFEPMLREFPDARLVTVPMEEFSSRFVIRQDDVPVVPRLTMEERRLEREAEKVERKRMLTKLLSDSRRLGTNHLGQQVWSYGEDMRFALQQEGKKDFSILAEGARDGLNPGLFMRATTPAAAAAAADGFVEALAGGETRRYDDLCRFAGALYGNGEALDAWDSMLLEADGLIETAMARWLAKRPTRSSAEHFQSAQRMQEARAYRADLARHLPVVSSPFPLPLAVAMQRILGTESELRDSKVMTIGAPNLGVFVAKTAKVSSWSDDQSALESVMGTGRKGSSVMTADTPVEPGVFGILVAQPRKLSVEAQEHEGLVSYRQDIIEAARLLSSRADEGRMVMAFEAPRDELEEKELAAFHLWAAQRYAIEGALRVPGTMGTADPLAGDAAGYFLLSVGQVRPAFEQEPPAVAMEVAHRISHPQVSAWVSEVVVARAAIGNAFADAKDVTETAEGDKDDENQKEIEANKYQSQYVSLSNLGIATTMVPRNLEAATYEGQQRILKAHPDFDGWVTGQIGMTKAQAEKRFSPEQIDAIGMTLHAFERDRGALVGDQAGLGKGRAMAGVALAAILRGEKVFFATERAIGLGEIMRDFQDIGGMDHLVPLVLNGGVDIRDIYAKLQPGETELPVLLESTDRQTVASVMATGQLPAPYNIAFFTYSQVNKLGELPEPKAVKKSKKKLKQEAAEAAKANLATLAADAEAADQEQAAGQEPVLAVALSPVAGSDDIDDMLGFSDIEAAPLAVSLAAAQPEAVDEDLEDEEDEEDDEDANPLDYDDSKDVLLGADSMEGGPVAVGVDEDDLPPVEGVPEGVNPKSWWLRRAVNKNSVLILDECHRVALGKSNSGLNIATAVERAKNVMFSSATYSKNARTMRIYGPMFPPEFDTSNLSEIISRGGDDMHAIVTSMFVRDAVMQTRQHDLTNAVFKSVLDTKHEARNHEYMDRLAPVLSEMSFLSGDISRRLNDINKKKTAELMAKYEGDTGKVDSKMGKLELRSIAFGSPLAQLRKLCMASLLVDVTVDGWIEALENGRKPLAFVENTIQGLMSEIQADNEETDGTRLPDFRDLLHRVLKQITKVKKAGKKGGEAVEVPDPFIPSKEELLADRIAAHVRAAMTPELLADADPDDYEVSEFDAEGKPVPDEIRAPWKMQLYQMVTAATDAVCLQDGIDMGNEDAPKTVMMLAAIEQVRLLVDNLHVVRSDNVDILRSFPEYLVPTPARARRRIASMIGTLPPLPASAIDEIIQRVEAEGQVRFERGEIDRPWVIGEMTGRSKHIVDGRIIDRKRPSNFEVRDQFNNGQIDGLIFNQSGATSVSLHASSRCLDQSQREMWFLATPGDIWILLQAIGRIYRFDQVIGPIIVTPVSGMPAQAHLLGIQEVKLSRLSANVQSSKEHPASLQVGAKLMNVIGDIVVRAFMEDNLDIVKRMNMESDLEQKETEEDESKDNEARDNDFIAHKFLSRLQFLPYELQASIMIELGIRFDATVQEFNDKGDNPLETRLIRGNVLVKKTTLFEGGDIGSEHDSVFYEPVFVQDVTIEHMEDPIRSAEVGQRIDSGMAAYTMHGLQDLPAHLKSQRETYLKKELMPGQTIEQAFMGGGAAAASVKRFDKLMQALPMCLPGMVVEIMHEGGRADAVIATVYAPQGEEEEKYFQDGGKKKHTKRSEFQASNYTLDLLIPGTFAVSKRRLGSLLNEPGFKFVGHISEEVGELPVLDDMEVMQSFDDALDGKRLSYAKILVGNSYAANQLMHEHSLGFPVVFVDDNGNRVHGVKVNKKLEDFNYLPIRMTGPEKGTVMASELLGNVKVKLYGMRAIGGGSKKDTQVSNGVVATYVKKYQKVKISLPDPFNTKHHWIMNKPSVAALVAEMSVDDPVTQSDIWLVKKKCLLVEPKDVAAVLKVFVDAGLSFYAPSSCRKDIDEWKASHHLDAVAGADQVEELDAENDNQIPGDDADGQDAVPMQMVA